MKLLLDTNAYSALMRGQSEVVEMVRKAELVLISSIVAGELMFGFRNENQVKQNLSQFEDFLASPLVDLLPVTLTTADRFSCVTLALRQKGRPMPTNDIWIAAHTLESGADILSYDQHFGEIDGLPWIHL